MELNLAFFLLIIKQGDHVLLKKTHWNSKEYRDWGDGEEGEGLSHRDGEPRKQEVTLR